ncbi:SRPBCC family protein [Streptomyces longispororuber]|nr:SRPBCC family protein [Streptomyces longispororuber]
MEHEVFVPVPEEQLREALADPGRVARAVPGLQRDADPGAGAPPVSGRLKVRVGGHSITYRGGLRVAPGDGGAYELTGAAEEVRGSGAVTFSLALRLAAGPEGGTRLAFAGTATGDGRVAEVAKASPQAVESAMRRLLGRFAEGLGTVSGEAPEAGEGGDLPSAAGPEPGAGAEAPGGDPEVPRDVSRLFEGEVPPPSLDPLADGFDVVAGAGAGAGAGADAGAGPEDEPVAAEAAHARRTMIGRSAEEVDHAPPRGRYAPVPAPESLGGGATLRWAAPAAAVLVASAIVAGRAWRRRR